jgi:hypothetical protein
MLSGLVPTWTLLAALTAGLILGVLASRLFTRSPTVPAVPSPQEPAPLAEAPAPEVVSQEEPASQPAAPEESQPESEPEPAPATAAAEPEPVRISMEDVVSELERRYQGRQAEAASEKPRPGGRRRRSR